MKRSVLPAACQYYMICAAEMQDLFFRAGGQSPGVSSSFLPQWGQ